ncbi:hypothetical protein JCM1840_005858 [Sporobolomyces johnsonii]
MLPRTSPLIRSSGCWRLIEMEPLAPYARWLGKKLFVLDQSLGKIENASYNLRIRGAEYKDSPKMLQELARKMATDSGPQRGEDGLAAA